MEEHQSAKGFLEAYVKAKGLNKSKFATSLGLHRNFLASSGDITVNTLQKIVNHPDYRDFNHRALLKGEGGVIKKLDDPMVKGIRERMDEITSDPEYSTTAVFQELVALLKKSLDNLEELKEEQDQLQQHYQSIRNFIKKEFKMKWD